MSDADSHLLSSKILAEKELFHHACFHAQQATELGLKALFILNNVPFEYDHSIVELIKGLKDTYPIFSNYGDEAATLTGHVVKTRYPDLKTGIPPRVYITKGDAERAISGAEKILKSAQEIYGRASLESETAPK